MSLTKEEFDKRLDDTLEDARMWCWCDSEGCEGNRQRVNAKQALRQLMLDVIGDNEVDYDHEGYASSRNGLRAELREIAGDHKVIVGKIEADVVLDDSDDENILARIENLREVKGEE